MGFRAFDAVFDRWMARGLHAIRIAAATEELGSGPWLLCSNHVSWWDGFLVRALARRILPDRPHFTIMLDRELARRRWLRRLGALGVTPGSTASVRAMLRQVRLLRELHPDAALVFFPQGRIWPSSRRPLGFERGIEAVQRALRPVAIVPVGIHLEPGRHPRPTAYVRAGTPVPFHDTVATPILEEAVQAELNLIHRFLAKYGEEADAHPFEEAT